MSSLLGPIMLIAGTSIGIGMLTLPAFLSACGLVYGSLVIIFVWLLMWAAALALAEISWYMPVGTNMLNMSEKTISKVGKYIMCATYIMLLFSLSSAYLSSLHAIMEFFIPKSAAWNLYLLIAAMFMLLIAKFGILDSFNRFLMLIMILSFCTLVVSLSLSPKHLDHVVLFGNTSAAIKNLPLLITSFGFQIVVPSVRKILANSSKIQMQQALFFGGLVPLIFYCIYFVLMMYQLKPEIFAEMINSGQPVSLMPDYLARVLQTYWIKPISLTFVCSAIATSWLGVSLSIRDFFHDSILKNYSVWITLIPPAIFVLFWPNGFMLALQYSGYLVSILLIIFPAFMLYKLRRKVVIKEKFINQKIIWFLMLFGTYILTL